MPRGRSVRQAIFGDQTNRPLLDTPGVQAVGQRQVGKVSTEAAATVEAAMAGEGDQQIHGALGPSIPEVVEGTGAEAIAAGTVMTARAAACRPVATAPLKARLGQVFDTSDALGDIRDILPWTFHRLLS